MNLRRQLLALVSAFSIKSSAAPTVTADSKCCVTAFADVPAATAACNAITLDGLYVPGNQTLDMSVLETGTTVTFVGTTTFGFAEGNYDMIKVGGTNITITAAEGAIIDGNGQAWWDGMGSNGGITKPDHFFVVSKLLGDSLITNLTLKNCCAGLTVENILLDNTAGNAPNHRSAGLPAAHNSDGFDLSSCNDTVVRNAAVWNQDDCVAVTSGNNITVSRMYCDGGHGLSIGSVGGKSNNNVTNILFEESVVRNSQNGARIKSNAETTGYIANITYQNIAVSNVSIYGIDIQQDYLNGGPTGDPTNGVIITGVTMTNITGTAAPDAYDYYIFCGDGSCSNFKFNDVSIIGGSNSSCNVEPEGDFVCDS